VRKIIWMMSVSVDGYMEGPNREIEWHMVDDELFRHLNGWLAGARRQPSTSLPSTCTWTSESNSAIASAGT
jgi:hypothetical protein